MICRALFRNDKGHIYVVPDDQLKQMFAIFDKNQDGFIDRDEFHFCWNHWIKTVCNFFYFKSFEIEYNDSELRQFIKHFTLID